MSEMRQRVIERRRENKEFRDFWKDFLRNRGVPKKFQSVETENGQLLNAVGTLKTFQSIVKYIRPAEDRMTVVRQLNNIVTGQTGGEDVGYVQQRLGYYIYREVTGEPYTSPRYASLISMNDVINSNFLNLICRGICAYKNASPENRIKFNKAVTPRVKKGNVVDPIIQQQQNVR